MPTLDFKGKQFVYAHHLSVPFRTLDVDAKKSLPPSGKKPTLDDNLIIHGDNLHALKALLPAYAGKVDCIIIDPPYNTGNEGWCYNDNVRSPLMKEWLKKSANPVDKEDLERHDKWCCMMWPRLCLLRELLQDLGTIWITLDDNEMHRGRAILDEVFGEKNFLACVAWRKRYTRSNNAKMFYSQKDHVLVYRKTEFLDVIKEPRTEKSDATYSNPDKDPRGPWMTSSYVNPATKDKRKNLAYPIPNPSTGTSVEHPTHAWKYKPSENKRHIAEKRLWWGNDGNAEYPRLKLYLQKAEQLVPVDFWNYDEVGSSDDGSDVIKRVFGSSVFDNPKPVGLVRKILSLLNNREAVVLDSFAGSGTTAHAVLEANRRDGGSRRFILVECEDYADSITAERIRRVIKGYSFQGTQREDLYRRKLSFAAFKKADEILGAIEGIDNLEEHRFDRISKTIKKGELIVAGEKKITEEAEGLGGAFTFCTLGQEINLQTLLAGENLPDYAALAKYVFYTATGQTLLKVPKPGKIWFIGATQLYRVHLIYKPDKKWLRSNASALTQELVDAIAEKADPMKKSLVFGSTKFMGQKELTRRHIEFCQLPYAIYRVLGD